MPQLPQLELSQPYIGSQVPFNQSHWGGSRSQEFCGDFQRVTVCEIVRDVQLAEGAVIVGLTDTEPLTGFPSDHFAQWVSEGKISSQGRVVGLGFVFLGHGFVPC